MFYEISNVVFNHKPTKWEITHKNPFHASKRKGNDYFLVEDKPQALFDVFQRGHCIKPHAPTSPRQAIAHTIVLDFDNLTKEQCEFVKSIVDGAYEFKNGEHEGLVMCGDYSVGTKVRLHENEDIPNYVPPKWGYKVFYPIERVVMKEEIYDAFLEAVAFFNPIFPMDEVRRVFKAWVRCNNNKKRNDRLKVTDPIFNGWVLPDVAMLNNFRNQITYGVDVGQREKVKDIGDETISRYSASMSKFPSTSKGDWRQGLWEANEVGEAKVEQRDEKVKATVLGMLKESIQTQGKTHLPTSKPQFSQMLGIETFNDLVLPQEDMRRLNAACWGKTKNLSIDLYKMKLDATLIGKTIARLAYELKHQDANSRFPNGVGRWMVEDCISFFKSIHGMQVFSILDDKQASVVLDAMARAISKALDTFKEWRTREKLKRTLSDPIVIEARDKWRRTRDCEDGKSYLQLREEDFKRRMSNPPSMPYAYRRRGLKKELVQDALRRMDAIPTIQDWVEWVKRNMTNRDGVVDDDAMASWYREYREKWNEMHKASKIQCKKRKSKWAELFQGKSLQEIEAIINGQEISKQMKYKLRKRYLSLDFNDIGFDDIV